MTNSAYEAMPSILDMCCGSRMFWNNTIECAEIRK